MTDLLYSDAAAAPAAPWTVGPEARPAPAPAHIRRRRHVVLALNVVTIALLLAAMIGMMAFGGFTWFEIAMLVPYALTLPWLSIGLWNALIGRWLTAEHADPATHVTPALARAKDNGPITTRTAIVMPLRNEDPEASLARLAAVEAGLAATPWADHFDFYVLSDTDQPEIAAQEERLNAAWQAARPMARISYRRRTENHGFKAGNIAEFVGRTHRDYDFFLPLDADSVMRAPTTRPCSIPISGLACITRTRRKMAG
ncbi:MAG: hypothetical protein AAFR44_08890, partial [Pseudomonadota bacterium]